MEPISFAQTFASAGLTPSLFLVALLLILGRVPLLRAVALIPYRVAFFFLRIAGIARPPVWSTVYDAKTRQPIDPAYVRIYDRLGTLVASAVTDLDGRFAFLLPRGVYRLEVEKTHYTFPSTYRPHRMRSIFGVINRGDWFEVSDAEQSIRVAVPMDALAGDWNQEEKRRGKYSLGLFGVNYLGVLLSYSGVIILTSATFFSNNFGLPTILMYAIGGMLLLVWVINTCSSRVEAGSVTDSNGRPVANAAVTITTAKTNIKMNMFRTSLKGRFVSLLPNNTYIAHITGVSETGIAFEFTSNPFEVRRGAVVERFTIPTQ
jgi:hypothetical protein